MTAFNPIAITFCGYLLLMVIIGFIAWHYTRDFNDYVLGGRRLGGLVTALSVGGKSLRQGFVFIRNAARTL